MACNMFNVKIKDKYTNGKKVIGEDIENAE